MRFKTTLKMDAVGRRNLFLIAAFVVFCSPKSVRCLSAAEKQELLDIHNTLRRLEGSSNMQIMVWDDTLALIAQNWTDGCLYQHGQGVNASTISQIGIGQNLYAATGSLNLTNGVVSWYNEKPWYIYDNVTCAAPTGKACGHYTQVTWAKSNRVGCGYTICPTLQTLGWINGAFLTCNYAPAGNLVGASPFLKGPACSQCDSGQFYCNNGLCDNSCTAPSANCVCQALCKNCGSMTANCQCQCGTGWWGGDCSKQCVNTDANCGANPGWPSTWCTAAHQNVLDSCPVLCSECVSGTPATCATTVAAAATTTAVKVSTVAAAAATATVAKASTASAVAATTTAVKVSTVAAAAATATVAKATTAPASAATTTAAKVSTATVAAQPSTTTAAAAGSTAGNPAPISPSTTTKLPNVIPPAGGLDGKDPPAHTCLVVNTNGATLFASPASNPIGTFNAGARFRYLGVFKVSARDGLRYYKVQRVPKQPRSVEGWMRGAFLNRKYQPGSGKKDRSCIA